MLSSFDKMDDVWEIYSSVIFWMLLYFIHINKDSSFINFSQSFNDQAGSVSGIVFAEGVLRQLNSQILWYFIQSKPFVLFNVLVHFMPTFLQHQFSGLIKTFGKRANQTMTIYPRFM